MAVTKTQWKKLEPLLASEQPNEKGEIYIHCPFGGHERGDATRSASLNVETGAWFCHAHDMGGSLKQLLDQLDNPEFKKIGRKNASRTGSEPAPLPSRATLAGWTEALSGEPWGGLSRRRGLNRETAREFSLGWDRDAQAYTIPVFDEAGQLVNVRRYQLDPPDGRRKIWSIRGRGGAVLFPAQTLDDISRQVIICEGELDALLTIQHGFDAITKTGGAKEWKPEWNNHFEGKDVYLAHDCDKDGQAANRKVARSLEGIARTIHFVELPFPITADHGKDLTDYWMEGYTAEDFKELLANSKPTAGTKQDLEVVDISVLETMNASHVGEVLRTRVTVTGKLSNSYGILESGTFTCDQQAGTKCLVCPMNKERWNGERSFEMSGDNPLILAMMHTNSETVLGLLRQEYGIQKCGRLEIDDPVFRTVEELYVRPSIDKRNEEGADYQNRKIVSVGDYDTMANATVEVTGTLWPNPKTQVLEYQAWEVESVETSIDRFDVTPSVIKQLTKFKPSGDLETPWKKAMAIAEELMTNVTKIYGRPDMHMFMDLVWHSVLLFTMKGEDHAIRGWLDALIVGDTRTGKSEAASRLSHYFGVGEIISCETASIAGIVGGLQQVGGRDWFTSIGAVPINDRRLVVLDEVSGLDKEKISDMSSMRSSGVAELNKIKQERAMARTRLLWLSNPRGGSMADYGMGIKTLEGLIGNPEDIARFDMAMSVHSSDVPAKLINEAHAEMKPTFTSDDCNLLLRWVWSRKADQVIVTDRAQAMLREKAIELGKTYVESPPLVQAANMRYKLARIAAAFAARTYSADSTGELIMVRTQHVTAAVRLLDLIYSAHGFGYKEHSKEAFQDRQIAADSYDEAKKFILTYESLPRFLRQSGGHFRRQDLEDWLNMGKDTAGFIINSLAGFRMLRRNEANVTIEPELHEIIRTIKD